MNFMETIKKLQVGINKYIDKQEELAKIDSSIKVFPKVIFNTEQFYSREQRRPINMYVIRIVEWNEAQDKNEYTRIFRSAQQLHVVLFLRNLLYVIRGEQIVPESDNIPNYQKFNTQWQEFSDEYL